MTSVLSLRPQSPFKRSFSDNPYLRCSPLKDNTISALRTLSSRNVSACSLYTLGAVGPGDWLVGRENTPPLTSRSLLELGQGKDKYESDAQYLDGAPRKRSCGTKGQATPVLQCEAPLPALDCVKRKEVPSEKVRHSDHEWDEPMVIDCEGRDASELFDLYDAIQVPLPDGAPPDHENKAQCGRDTSGGDEAPFRRWVSILRRRHIRRRKEPYHALPHGSKNRPDVDTSMFLSVPLGHIPGSPRPCSDSLSSSMGCITATRSASITVASTSLAPHSERAGPQLKARMGQRSSTFSEVRKSTDSNAANLGPILDESAWLRSVQRRKIVEEIISSEESYIGDLKILINVSVLFPVFWGGLH
jgi:hypothetical protein